MEYKRQRNAARGDPGETPRQRTGRPNGGRPAPGREDGRNGRELSRQRTAESGRRRTTAGSEGTGAPREASRHRTAGEGSGKPVRRNPEQRASRETPRQRPGRTAPGTSTAGREEKPAVLSERSVKAAKKRQALREENARLRKLREKQKRQAKRRTVKRISKGLFKRLVIMAGVVVAVILSMVIFFRVETVEIRGNSYYSREEILEVCGVAEGDHLLTLPRGEIAGNIRANLRYVESMKISRQLPNTLIIEIREGKPGYVVQDTGGSYYLMNAEGKIVEKASAGDARDFTLVEDLQILPPVLGEEAQVYGAEGEETKARGQLTALKELLQAIEAASLGRQIASVQVPSSFHISLWYEDRFLVELGNTSRIDYKLEYLKAVVEKEESYVTGTVDLTLRDGDKAILLRGE